MRAAQTATESRPQRTRAAVSNGTRVLTGIDGRSATARRFRDLITEFSSELGPFDELSEAHRGLVKQAAALMLRAEQLQAAVVRGEAVDDDLLVRLSAEARRTIAAITTARHGMDGADFLTGLGRRAG